MMNLGLEGMPGGMFDWGKSAFSCSSIFVIAVGVIEYLTLAL